MCGILGMTPPPERARFRAALSLIAHRGPDGEGVYADDRIVLGHRRLSILDVSESGHQPMAYGNGRVWTVFNGEIYNFLELRGELEQLGHRFVSESDTEVVLAAYQEWGPDCFLRFNGMWAVAIWEPRTGRLFLSRDRFGKKPLFYSISGGKLLFGSEMKALLPLMEAVAPNAPAIRRAVANPAAYEATDECLIQGIKRFPAGHHAVWDGKQLVLSRYWSTVDHLVAVPARYEEQVEMFHDLFVDACRIRMRSDVPIGTALSGGLDSSATISVMAAIAKKGGGSREADDWQHAFVATFPGTILDERKYAEQVVHHLGIEATYLEVKPGAMVDDLMRGTYLFEEIWRTGPLPFFMTYGAIRDVGVKVTIDGHGADELFGGYGFDVMLALRDAGWNLPRARMVLGTLEGMYDDVGPAHRPWKNRWVFWARNRISALRGGGAAGIPGGESYPSMDSNLNRALYARTHDNVLPTLLRNYDRYSMGSSVEIRMPFMDHRIVSFAFSIPWDSKVRRGFSKCIVRDAMARYLPGPIAWRKGKIGFNSPTAAWLRGPLRSWVLDTMSDQTFAESHLVDQKETRRQVHQLLDDNDVSIPNAENAWLQLQPYLWEKAFLNGPWRKAVADVEGGK